MTTTPDILMVEDDAEQALLFCQVLHSSGYQVAIAATAEEAQASLAASPFELLLSDWFLPGMMGDTLISLVKTQYPAVKTILFSNHTDVDRAAEAVGADAWFRKIDGIIKLRQLVMDMVPPETDHD